MQTIILQFQTPQDLSGFRKMAADYITDVSILHLTIRCKCNLPEIALAMNYYGAKVLDNQKPTQS
ncbi:MAG TPA: hypothetical protein VD794_06055 [Flavisolibacter sp.]|nr:hypothetical protein [Flavisolibacter sp.]